MKRFALTKTNSCASRVGCHHRRCLALTSSPLGDTIREVVVPPKTLLQKYCCDRLYCKALEMEYYTLLGLAVLAVVRADSENAPSSETRQFTYNSQYPVDLQYDFSLVEPQLQYPPFSGGSPRVQPQVFIYPSGAPGQPFLLQPGAPPGNFLIPQPQPGFVFRDVPSAGPSVFNSGYPKPAYVPPINKDAEEIPANPGGFQPSPPLGRKPEKLETFDEKPELERPFAGEADVLASADRTSGRNPSLKPGHRFFILNGQPLFSNYPLPQFANSPYQPTEGKFGPKNNEFYTYSRTGPSFLPHGFSKPQINDIQPYKVPIGNFFVRNAITGQINSAKQNDYKNPQNEVNNPENFVSLNQRDEPISSILSKNLPIFPYQTQDFEAFSDAKNSVKENPQRKTLYPRFKLNPIDVPNAEDNDGILNDKVEDKEPTSVTVNPDPSKEPTSEDTPTAAKKEEPSISRSQPTALALAGPGGVAAAAPRATALTGDRGVSVSSPQATAIAGPSKDQVKEIPKNRKQ